MAPLKPPEEEQPGQEPLEGESFWDAPGLRGKIDFVRDKIGGWIDSVRHPEKDTLSSSVVRQPEEREPGMPQPSEEEMLEIGARMKLDEAYRKLYELMLRKMAERLEKITKEARELDEKDFVPKAERQRENIERYLGENSIQKEGRPTIKDRVTRYERNVQNLEGELEERKVQRGSERDLDRRIRNLETTLKRIKEEAQDLEETALEREAQKFFRDAERLEDDLKDLRKQLFHARKEELPKLQKKYDEIERKTREIGDKLEQLLEEMLKKEMEARQEDELTPEEQKERLKLRIAEFYRDRALHEFRFFSNRGRYIERALAILQSLDEEKYPDVKEKKEQLRERNLEVTNFVSEGLLETNLEGDELPLPYTMRDAWRKDDKEGFYQRLRALHQFLSDEEAPDAPEGMRKAILSLLEELHGSAIPPEEVGQRKFANEARRFLQLTGNGVIRRFIEELYNGLRDEPDYARLGQDLELNKGTVRNPTLYLLQIAANIPRIFDLSLTERFERIFQQRQIKRRVKNVTKNLLLGRTGDPAELGDVPVEELGDPAWPVALAEGELPVYRYEDRRLEPFEVGQRKTVEAQEYLLDVSGSMADYRWIFNNAVFMSALNTFSVDAKVRGEKTFSNLLFLRLFGAGIHDLEVIRNEKQAFRALKRFFSQQGEEGATEIQKALMKAFKDIRNARTPQLRGAKIVLVTDGGDPNLDGAELAEAQRATGTPIITHMFGIEMEEEYRRELEALRIPGKSFFHEILHASDQNLAALPPYAKDKRPFSPVYIEPEFQNEIERRNFYAGISKRCDEIVELDRRIRAGEERKQREQTKQFEQLFLPKPSSDPTPYEQHRKPFEAETRFRRGIRAAHILDTMIETKEETKDEYLTAEEAMAIFDTLAKSRAMLPRDYRALLQRTKNPVLLEAIKNFRTKLVYKLLHIKATFGHARASRRAS